MSLEQVLAKLDQINDRLNSLESKVGGGGGSGSGASASTPARGGGGGGDSAAVSAYQDIIDEHLAKFVELSNEIGSDVAAIAPLVMECVHQQKALIAEASQSKKPSAGDLQKVLGPLSVAIGAVTAFQSKSRDHKLKNNVYGVGEGIGIFGWVAVEPTPAPYANEMVGAAKFYTNKVLQEHKGSNETQVAWTHAWTGFAEALIPYIKKFHTTGLAWNPRGGEAKTPASGAAPKAAPAPAAKPAASTAPKKMGGNLFGELNKGGAITSGLKKVAREETNKDKKISGKVEIREKAAPVKKAAHPSKLELQGTKWVVEYHVNPSAPVVVKITDKKETVYIYKCENAVIIIEGKVNSIAMDGCKKVGLVFDDCLATCEVMNCASVKVQVKTKIPAIAVDKTAGLQVYLPATSLDTEIISATSSEMNVVIPNPSGKEEDDPIEMPIPEQFKTVVQSGKLVTAQVDHSGG